MKINARQLALAKALYNQIYYLANADRWATTYAGNRRRKLARGRAWTPADERLLSKLYPCTDTDAVAARLGRTCKSVRSRAKLLGLRKNNCRSPWSKAERTTLRRIYPDHSTAWVAKQLNRRVASINAQASLMGLKKSPAHLAAMQAEINRKFAAAGAAHRFQKGLIPANKGMRRPGFGPGRMKETQFKKGGRNANYMPVGTTRMIYGYLFVKVADVQYVPYTVNWKAVHVLEWERANGKPLPGGYCLRFIDGDRMNTSAGNLELISRAENMRRNTVHNLPKELVQLVQLRGQIVRQINKRGKREEPDRRPA